MTETSTTTSAPVTRRVPFWDNARFAAVTLVVIGHGIQRLTPADDTALVVYLLIYSFHIPAFAIISGYFSASGPPTVRHMKRVLTDLILPYLIMETIWTIVQFVVEGRREFNPTTASWTLWFLLALAIFRLVLPYLALLRWPLLWSVVLSIGVGYLPNVDSTFSLSRAIGLLPFFVLGWKLKEWGLVDRWRLAERVPWALRAASIGAFVAWTAVLIVFIQPFRDADLRYWMFYLDPYVDLGNSEWWAGLLRLGLIVVAVILSAAFLLLVPRSASWISTLGQGTMYVYLLHSFVLYPVRESGILSGDVASPWVLIAVIIGCIGVSIVLATAPVRTIFRPLIEPRATWLFRNDKTT
ncbi:fucose 4-O-acetylase-like acetyltransferase [Microbacteriaceae bacterium SG_E_30_P1]|uniref:Fucose 4-O-acetylase-like acetyltransferase n=1 Tax=Antiquaquibacter oligotrophicus TaxID=2880260 RepID=A0ABT6KKW8_9MICO|nr:acyltransferase family protein [Antiquaquibacter oligotrophicus]MDH6180514.1 fucose 4-O-acetylase-like acetyltransferase [Antiquaquibacter oligotrophicus]UDF13752.1 acyltransferase family protein [Antiquaquibacter oligotrophicus]